MPFHASLLVAVGYALALPFVPAEPLANRHRPSINHLPAFHAAVTVNSDLSPALQARWSREVAVAHV